MAISFTLARTIDVSGGFSADPNPNTTNPAATAIAGLPDRTSSQSADAATRSVLVYVRAITKADGIEKTGATATFTIWARDDGASAGSSAVLAELTRFVAGAAGSHAAVPSSQCVQEKLLGEIYVQLTAASLAGADTLEVWVAATSAN